MANDVPSKQSIIPERVARLSVRIGEAAGLVGKVEDRLMPVLHTDNTVPSEARQPVAEPSSESSHALGLLSLNQRMDEIISRLSNILERLEV